MLQLGEHRGSSGAVFEIYEDQVRKLDTPRTGARVREQGIWLQMFPHQNLPAVTKILPNGYEMEKLEHVALNITDPMFPIDMVVKTWQNINSRWLGRDHYTVFIEFDVAALRRYVIQICQQLSQGTLGLTLLSVVETLDWSQLKSRNYTPSMWTHGDPIIDNLMRRDTTLVLIDPIPPTPAIPSHPMVDWGRFIQSAAGYEQIRYTNEFPDDTWPERVTQVLNKIHGADPFYSAFTLVYGVIGMLRGARTAPTSDTKLKIIIQAQNLTEELLKWTR